MKLYVERKKITSNLITDSKRIVELLIKGQVFCRNEFILK